MITLLRPLVATLAIAIAFPGTARAWGIAPPGPQAAAAPLDWARRTCDALMTRSPVLTDRWHYDVGLVLSGFESVWRQTGDRRYFDYIKSNVDRLVGPGGVIKGYEPGAFILDDVNMGKVLFALLAESRGEPASSARHEPSRGVRDPVRVPTESKNAVDGERYRAALFALRAQLTKQPRTADGGFWHKQIYPHQMWADGVYMASPFLARFASVFGDAAALDDAIKQVLLAESHLRDAKTGLLYHGWDESKKERWANAKSGLSPQFWGRGDGWYAMAVADVLAEMPKDHPRRPAVVAVLRRLARALAGVQDKASGVWWQVLDAGGRPRNFKEASASAMFVYAIAKGSNSGWLDAKKFAPVAARGYAGILKEFVVVDDKDGVHVARICKVAGLGGDPYRDGSYDYYVGTEVVADDPKGVGAFILASAEQR